MSNLCSLYELCVGQLSSWMGPFLNNFKGIFKDKFRYESLTIFHISDTASKQKGVKKNETICQKKCPTFVHRMNYL